MTVAEAPSETVELISDDELTALALAAGAGEWSLDDAVPWTPDGAPEALVADWYMPAAVTGRHSWKARAVAGSFVLALVLINAAGLCVTYGQIVLA